MLVSCIDVVSLFFFFQAEDGIRDLTVTGVQTCALPICGAAAVPVARHGPPAGRPVGERAEVRGALRVAVLEVPGGRRLAELADRRSEERRVGKECRSRWSPYH